MKNSMRFFGVFLAAMVLLPGCMRVPSYKHRSLQSVSDHCTYRGAEKDVIMRAKLLSRADKSSLFGSRSALIHDNDFQVIYISTHNLSGLHYLLSSADIDLSMISYQDIAQLMKTNSVSRLTGSVIDGVISYSFGVTAIFTIADLGISSFLCATAFLTPSVVCAGMALAFFGTFIKSIIMNNRIKKDLAEKTLHIPVIIPSGGQYEGLIFIKSSDYTPTFAVTMHEKDNVKNTITFDVDLRQNEE